MGATEIPPSRLSLGTKVSVITGAQYRYEGTVAAINSIEGTLTLQNVCFWGLENRIAENSANQNSEKKLPNVGSVFNLITFWMSSIVQIYLSPMDKQEKNDIADKGIAKAGVPVDVNRSRGRRSRNWWQQGDQQRSEFVGTSPTDGLSTMDNMAMGRYSDPMTNQMMHNQPRMLVSYPRRGRNSAMFQRHTGYVPVVPVMAGPGGMRRSGYGISPSYRMTPLPPGSRMGSGRRPGPPPMRHMMGNGDDHRYAQHVLNPTGGVLVYLPPEMAAAYQSHGINFVSTRPPMGRRRPSDRRGASRGPETNEPEIDCTTPYDFEAANAELEAELAKITINPDGVPVNISAHSVTESNSVGPGSSTSLTLTGDSQSSTLRSPSTISAAGNGASGDSTHGAVTSSVTSDSQPGATVNADGSIPLAKGEYYVREKCFFDQISRPESGIRSSYTSEVGRGGYNGRTGFGGPSSGQVRRSVYGHTSGMGFGSLAAARRERQLNLETFGSMAARTTFAPRRRGPPPGHVTRDYLVSAPA